MKLECPVHLNHFVWHIKASIENSVYMKFIKYNLKTL